MQYYVRAPVKKEVEQLRAKLVACAEGAAKATGCKVMFIHTFLKKFYLLILPADDYNIRTHG